MCICGPGVLASPIYSVFAAAGVAPAEMATEAVARVILLSLAYSASIDVLLFYIDKPFVVVLIAIATKADH